MSLQLLRLPVFLLLAGAAPGAAAGCGSSPAVPMPMDCEPMVPATLSGKQRITFVGDSITYGEPGPAMFVTSGFRGFFFEGLVAMGKAPGTDFDFVGVHNHATPPFGPPAMVAASQCRHEGYPGETPRQIRAHLAADWPLAPADVVFIHAGTNFGTETVTSQYEQVQGLVSDLLGYTPPPRAIFLWTVIKSADGPTNAMFYRPLNDGLNSLIPGLRYLSKCTDPKVHPVEGYELLDTTVDYSDSAHPDGSGYAKMGSAMVNALATLWP